MKNVKKLLLSLITIILSLILIFNIYNYVCLNVIKSDLATIKGYSVLEVVSGSMAPSINVGDLIVINTKDKNIKENDVVTFYDINNSFVTHRVIKIDDNSIITKGDANNTLDDEISKDKIVGKYVFKIKGLGNLINSFKSPFVMILILIIGILICFLVSTDKEGKAILSEEEKEFIEFKKSKKNK